MVQIYGAGSTGIMAAKCAWLFGAGRFPTGLSDTIRHFAFKYSESTYLRWLPLIIADRVSMMEGIVDDLIWGHIPNIIKGRG